MLAHACDPSIWASGVQAHPLLHSKFQVSLPGKIKRVRGDWKIGEEKKQKERKEKKTVGSLRHKTHHACQKPDYFHGGVNTAVFQKVAPVFPKPSRHLP